MVPVVDWVRPRVDPEPLTALVALVDLALIGVFVVVGEISHNVDPIASPWLVADTYTPFLLGWVAALIPGGLYAPDARSPSRAAGATAIVWVVAAGIAQLLRATSLFHGNAAPVFFAVSVAVGLTLLVPWRVTLAWLTGS